MTAASAGWTVRRGRTASVVTLLGGSAIALISSTQTWATTEISGAIVSSTGADAVPLLQPLSLAALASSLALALTGRVVRLVLAAAAAAIGALLVAFSVPVASAAPVSAIETAVTEHTGIAGSASVAELVDEVSAGPWAWAGVAGAVIVFAGGALALSTGARWARAGRRYESAVPRSLPGAGPLDAVDTWDDLSRGDDPTETHADEPPRRGDPEA
ncbi:Trp biosynthesis-associated membrane protein [Microbacterium suaedae]|uniref:Trp biosynthesis-associated membrane protein n=1 Tax=Microbacterium suaedae TaxID=2067813 RepID=UPI0013A602AC|nr:Trp biosynthesis-associated membrane protein [Microbacterium suaedae]